MRNLSVFLSRLKLVRWRPGNRFIVTFADPKRRFWGGTYRRPRYLMYINKEKAIFQPLLYSHIFRLYIFRTSCLFLSPRCLVFRDLILTRVCSLHGLPRFVWRKVLDSPFLLPSASSCGKPPSRLIYSFGSRKMFHRILRIVSLCTIILAAPLV